MNYGIDIRFRTIYLDDEISEESASLFVKCLRYLDKTAGNILIILNSDGGCVSSGFAIYDAIKLCINEVEIKVVGSAMSMASIILQAADKRCMSENSRMMIHRGEISLNDHISNVERAMKESTAVENIMINIYLSKIQESIPDFTRSKVKKLLEFDTFMSAEKCLELGLIDDIDG